MNEINLGKTLNKLCGHFKRLMATMDCAALYREEFVLLCSDKRKNNRNASKESRNKQHIVGLFGQAVYNFHVCQQSVL